MTSIDNEGTIAAGLRACGFNIDNGTTEVMIQIIEHIRKEPNATIKDILRVHNVARILVAEDGQLELERQNQSSNK
jgi:predicted small metal-binding protein